MRLAAWVALYVAANQLAYVVVIVLNNRFDAGPQIYTTAFIVFQLPHAIFAVSIFTALLPGMSERWATGERRGRPHVPVPWTARHRRRDDPRGARTLRRSRSRSPGSSSSTGRPSTRDAVAIGETLQGFAAGLLFFSSFQLLTRTFYAMQDTRTPALVNVGVGCVNIAAALLYTGPLDLGLQGMALRARVLVRRRARGSSCSSSVGGSGRSMVRGSRRRRRVPSIAAIASAAASVGVLGLWELPSDASVLTQAIHVGAAVAVGVLVFLISALILRVGEVDDLRKALVRRFRG